MKKYFIITCIIYLGFACNHSVNSNEFIIKGKLSGVDDGVVVGYYRGGIPATDTVRNGRFTIRGETTDQVIGNITIMGNIDPTVLRVWVAPGAKVKIKGNGRLSVLWNVKSAVPYQKEENRYTNAIRDSKSKVAGILLELREVRTKAMTASSEGEALSYGKIADSLSEVWRSLEVEHGIKEVCSDINIMEKTDITLVWLYKLANLADVLQYYTSLSAEHSMYFREKGWELYGRMSEEDKSSPIGYKILAALTPSNAVAVGDNMTDSDLLDMEGNTKHLSDYLGKYLLLDFWHSGCGPCIMAFPEIKEISETYCDKLTVISISMDTDSRWKATTAKHDMPWVNLLDPKGWGGLFASYGAIGTPTYIMISPEGKIIDKWWGGENTPLKNKVSENLAITQ